MKSRIFLLAFLSLVALNANALTIEITEGTTAASPIAIVPFEWQGASPLPEDIASVVESDLKRSGRFAPIDRKDMLSKPSSSAAVIFKNWRLLNVDHLVVGRIRPTTADEYVVQVQLVDVLREKQLAGYSYPVKRTSFRRLAHQISDMVYEQLTGEPGAFNTRVAYVTSSGGKQPVFNLYVADVDGYNAQSVLRSNEPIMSPS
ncbi:MAG: Tol-Pal system protein TolB, partial [Gammaproteobacteria bacterium]